MTTITDTERQPEEESEQELALADLDLPEERADDVTAGTRGGCDDWACGSNHNELLAVTA
jgi:hypothetical protein